MKRVASYFLLSLFLLNILGYYLIFIIQDSFNRMEIREMWQEENCLQTLLIPVSDLKNVVFKDEGKELLYKGYIYDIKSISRNGDFFVFHCINDTAEKQLLDGLDTYIKNNTDSGTSPNKKQKDLSKKQMQDLFLHQSPPKDLSSIPNDFPVLVFNFTFFNNPPLPPPPPEG